MEDTIKQAKEYVKTHVGDTFRQLFLMLAHNECACYFNNTRKYLKMREIALDEYLEAFERNKLEIAIAICKDYFFSSIFDDKEVEQYLSRIDVDTRFDDILESVKQISFNFKTAK